MQSRLKAVRIFLAAAFLTLGFAVTVFADTVTLNSTSEIRTGQGDILSTAVVNRREVKVWEIDKKDNLVLRELDLPYLTYRKLSIGILYPQPDGSYAIGTKEDGSIDYEKGAGEYLSLDDDLCAGDEYEIYDMMRFRTKLGGHTPDECLFYLMFQYDREDGPKLWTGDLYMKYVDVESLAHQREAINSWADWTGELPPDPLRTLNREPETETETETGEPENKENNGGASDSGQGEGALQTQPKWASNEVGWWVEYPDGTYLQNEWYRSPESGLWYYMGADGYMLTNADTPDGYRVDENGVWIQ